MADVAVQVTPAAATARAARNIVWTDAHTGYAFATTNGLHYAYRKTTDAGANWAAAVSLDAAANGASGQDVWYDRWTPGDTGTLIHCWWFEATTDTVFWRTIDTANSDTLGTVKSAFVGASVVAGRGSFCSGTKSRSGYLYVAFDIDAGTEHGIVRSTDSGATWSSNLASTFVEATIDECLLFPATGTGDNNDIWAIYQDASADALTMKMWDSSAAAEVESSTMQTMVENVTDNTGQRGFSGSVRHSDGHLIVVSCSEYDASTEDMQVWDVSGVTAASQTGITAKTDITTNIDDIYYPAVFVDQDTDNIYVAYNGKSDGSDTLGTTAKVYYAKSTDGGSSWSKDNALMVDSATTQLQVWAPLSGHRFGALWRIGPSGNINTNVTNSLCLYTLVAAQGSFTKSGQDIILKVSMPAAQASFTLSGQAVTLTYTPGGSTYTLTAAQGSFTRTGEAVAFAVAHKLDLNPVVADSYSESNSNTSLPLSSAFLHFDGVGQAFTATAGPLDRAVFYMRKEGSPTGNAVAKLYAITGTFGTDAKPTGTAFATSDNFDVSTLTTSDALITFQFSGANRYLLTVGTKYFIAVEYSGGGSLDMARVGYDSTSPSHSGNYAEYDSGIWGDNVNRDVCFYVYVAEGQGSFIEIGQSANLLLGHKIDGLTLVDSYSESNSDSQAAIGISNQAIAQAFTSSGGTLDSAKFFLKTLSAPTGNAVAKLYAITGTFGTNAIPTGTALAVSDAFGVSSLTSSFALITFQFSGANRYSMVNGTNYCISVEYISGDSNSIFTGVDFSSPSHAGNRSTFGTSTWTGSSTSDVCFYLYAVRNVYLLTGQDATLAVSMAADFGSFTDSGQTANLLVGRKLAADFGSFSDTGQSVNFYKGRTLGIGQGSFSLTGEDVTLKVSIPAEQASFTFTGQSVSFYKGRTLTAAQGAFALTGQATSFPLGRRFGVALGSFTLSGQDASLIFTPAGAFTIAANRGTFILSGQSALLEHGRFVGVDAGLFTETGQSISFSLGKVLAGTYGSFILSGQDADLAFQGILGLHSTVGEFALSGQSIFFSFNSARLKLDFDAPTRAGAQFGSPTGKSGVSSGKAKSNLTVELAA